MEPWRLQLLVQRSVGARDKAFLTFDVTYQVPERYVRTEQRAVVADTPDIPAEDATNQAAPPQGIPSPAQITGAPDQPLWQRIWRSSTVDIAILGTSLGVLTGIFFFQHQLVKRPRLYDRVRLAFLTFTLFWLGWWVTAQLSVVNVLTFTNALITGFSWDYFLLSPLVFLLWSAVAVSMLFWARGAFCGWLCPFGALQEFIGKLAQRLRLPQLTIRRHWDARLKLLKYLVLASILGSVFVSAELADKLVEAEPFKTAITLNFVRSWPFVLYAGALLAASAVVYKSFCRYLCPFGAGLAILGRIRLLDWLPRRRECGKPCQTCRHRCEYEAIRPDGGIRYEDCFQCMDCVVIHQSDDLCAPLILEKKRARVVVIHAATPS